LPLSVIEARRILPLRTISPSSSMYCLYMTVKPSPVRISRWKSTSKL
jgi:hypothetical protein